MFKSYTIQQTRQQAKRNLILIAAAAVSMIAIFVLGGVMQTQAATTTAYSNGFEADASGWAGSGLVTRAASGTGGVASATGGYHGVVAPSANGYSGPNSRLGGYSSTWPGDWSSSVDLYLDPSWDADSGFVYAVATNNVAGNNLRDYIFSAGVLNDASTGNVDTFVIYAGTEGSSTSDPLLQFREGEPAESPADRGEITTAGWYTLNHELRNIDGELVVSVSVKDADGELVRSWQIETGDLVPSQVGGNRYAWFTHVVVPGGLAIDNHCSAAQYRLSPTTSPLACNAVR